MALTNQNVIEVSQFALKAKKHIGFVKLAEIYTNQNYAVDILIKAVLTGDSELIKLVKSICIQLNIGIDLIIAVQSYMNACLAKQTNPNLIKDIKFYLNKLANYLYAIHIDGVAYRQVIDKLIYGVDIKDKAFCIDLARDFYPYCRNNYGLSDQGLNNIEASKEAFIRLWNHIDEEFFSDSESNSLNQYLHYLVQTGVSESDIQISSKIAKVIILEIRNHDQNLKISFRNVINKIQHYFSYQDMQGLFYEVSRQFYSFWVSSRSRKKLPR
ncbi:hypothetical protein [Methylotenera versatilis]|uniref:Uncharacterized protein n=1 Tax=Methylotenera versatilis (strain 301) TaxID=666681 RepID=D7DJH7_METV0|nr:hypothetical protein [Methylotenera versatilis]ADI30212.1 hypothetical protein M301_1838 [Methylotenera versatilis 301]